MLSLVAGGVGVGLAVWLLDVLLTADLPLPIPISLDLGLDGNVLAFTLSVSVVAGALIGLLPALQSTRLDLVSTLKSDTAGGGQPGQTRWRNALVVSQVTVSLVLLIGAGLFLRSVQGIQAVDPGFGREPTAIMSVMVPRTRFSAEERHRYVQRLLDRFQQVAGVSSVGLIDNLHLNTLTNTTIRFNVDGVDPPPEVGALVAATAAVDPGFFDAAGIELMQGRNFTDADRADSQPSVIISRAMAERFWPDADPLGRLLRRRDPDAPDLLVVGVAADAKVRSLGEAPRAMVYRPYAQVSATMLTVVARTTTDPERTALALMRAGREVDPQLGVWETKTMEQHLSIRLLPMQLIAFPLSAFAVLAVLLASIGLYGVVSYAVARRTREVGIRMAIGANRGHVMRLLTAGGLRLVTVGTLAGVGVALGATRLVAGLLFGVEAFDPLTFVAAPVVLGMTALVAVLIPALHASRIDPIKALHDE